MTPLDRYALEATRLGRVEPLRRPVTALNHAGRGGMVWLGLALSIGSGRRPLARLEATAMSLATIVVALLGSNALARAIGRRRPCHGSVRSLVPCPEGASFPSDQAAASFAAAEFLGWLRPEARTWLRGTAAAIAVARLAAGVHYATDVVAGGAFGWALGRLARELEASRQPDVSACRCRQP